MMPKGYKNGKPLGGHPKVGRKPSSDPKRSLSIPVKKSLCDAYKMLTKDEKKAVAAAVEREIQRWIDYDLVKQVGKE